MRGLESEFVIPRSQAGSDIPKVDVNYSFIKDKPLGVGAGTSGAPSLTDDLDDLIHRF